MNYNSLIPELYCSNFQQSLQFYTQVLGFSISYQRVSERFAFLERHGAQLMIEQSVNQARVWVIDELKAPFGRGVNLQIRTSNVKKLYETCQRENAKIFLPLEEKWYQVKDNLVGMRQFIVLDPDHYLLRFAQNID